MTDEAQGINQAAVDAAAHLAQATADAASVLAKAVASAAANVDEVRNGKIDIMFDRSERLEHAIFGNGKPGVISDVVSLKAQMRFVQWAGGTGTALVIAAVLRLWIR